MGTNKREIDISRIKEGVLISLLEGIRDMRYSRFEACKELDILLKESSLDGLISSNKHVKYNGSVYLNGYPSVLDDSYSEYSTRIFKIIYDKTIIEYDSRAIYLTSKDTGYTTQCYFIFKRRETDESTVDIQLKGIHYGTDFNFVITDYIIDIGSKDRFSTEIYLNSILMDFNHTEISATNLYRMLYIMWYCHIRGIQIEYLDFSTELWLQNLYLDIFERLLGIQL